MVEVLKIGTVQAAKGELATGTIRGIELSCGTWVDIPVILINGIEDGPTLLLTSTEHGDEIQGIEVIRQITRHRVDPKTLKGAIIAIPVMNPLAFMHMLYRSWIDNLDISEVDAATREDAPTTGLLANAIWEEIFTKVKIDMWINFHCNALSTALVYQEFDIRQPETRPTIEKMAKAFDVTSVYEGEKGTPVPEDAPSTLANLAKRHGIPTLLVELIEGGHISEPSTTVGVRGVLNVMKTFSMTPGDPEPQIGIPIVRGRCRYHKMVRCTRGGIIHLTKIPGEFIKKGEVIACIFDVWGNEVEAVQMPLDGYIWAYPLGKQLGTDGRLQIVNSGDDVAYTFIVEE
ncbi:MAG: succinylglutamate desuccinylase/aspartoacylase family protein [Candidatus Heimdallarchaeota archaeon]